jgi:AcrR family transcriptional regulator
MPRDRGQRAGIATEEVLDAALVLLRAEGLAAVTLRRLATELGVTPNAIYNHVTDKEALLDQLLDAVLGQIRLSKSRTWSKRVETVLADARLVMLQHADLLPTMVSRPMLGPNALRLADALLVDLREAGLPTSQAPRALQTLLTFAIGTTAFQLPRTNSMVIDPATPGIGPFDGDDVFRTGLRWILDGITKDAASRPDAT